MDSTQLRRLDPEIFKTPQRPLGFEQEIVPIEDRTINKDATTFTTTKNPVPFSYNYERTKGSFSMNLIDQTPVDVNESRDTARD
jgi:hypothetical protein